MGRLKKGKKNTPPLAAPVEKKERTLPLQADVTTTLDNDGSALGPRMCISCHMMHDMASLILQKSVEDRNFNSEVLREYRLMCVEISDCCGNPRYSSDDYTDEDSSATGVFWKNKDLPEEEEEKVK